MITNSQKPKYSYLRRLLFLPLLFSVTFVFALRAHQKQVADQTADLEAMVAGVQLESKADNTANAKSKEIVFRHTDSTKPTIVKFQDKDSAHKPLFIVDGKEQAPGTSLDDLEADEIESIHVYKEKYATGKYGDKGKNGVIEVITKAHTAKSGKTDMRAVTIVGYKEDNDAAGTPHTFTATKDAAAAQKSSQSEIVVQGHPFKTAKLKGKAVGLQLGKTNVTSEPKVIRDVKIGGYQPNPKDLIAQNKRQGVPGGKLPEDALYIIDGKKATQLDLNRLPANEINHISVLKNKASLEKFDAAGRTAVVVITTKKSAGHAPVFTQTMREPRFPGGTDAWRKYLERNLQSSVAVKNGAPVGTYEIIVSFLVDKKGSTSEFHVLSKPEKDYGTAAEAARVIKESGRWLPALQNGRPVAFRQKQKMIFQVSQ